jgi:hypothetical protein
VHGLVPQQTVANASSVAGATGTAQFTLPSGAAATTAVKWYAGDHTATVEVIYGTGATAYRFDQEDGAGKYTAKVLLTAASNHTFTGMASTASAGFTFAQGTYDTATVVNFNTTTGVVSITFTLNVPKALDMTQEIDPAAAGGAFANLKAAGNKTFRLGFDISGTPFAEDLTGLTTALALDKDADFTLTPTKVSAANPDVESRTSVVPNNDGTIDMVIVIGAVGVFQGTDKLEFELNQSGLNKINDLLGGGYSIGDSVEYVEA